MTNDNDLIRRGDAIEACRGLDPEGDIAAIPAVAASQPADPVINAGSRQRVVVKPDRDTFDAMCAMRNAINEYISMPSLESDLLQGPENSVFCATVAEAVIKSHVRLKRDLETANYQVERLQSSFSDMSRVAEDWMHKAEVLQTSNPVRVVVKPLELSNLLKHAFVFGWEKSESTSSPMEYVWTEYDPTENAAYARILAALDVQPDPRDGQIAALVEALKWAYNTLWEVNLNNYSHDDVCRLNDASVEVILGIAPLIGETH